MIGQAAHKVRNDDVRWQKISNYLRDKYGWTPREYFDGQNDASYGVNKYKTQEGVPPFIEPYIRKVAKESVDRFNESKNMNKKLIRLTESDLHRIVRESVQRILKETRLDYDEDNFSGRYSRNADNTIPYQGKLFAFDVDDRGKIYKYGQQPIDVISQCESEAERYGQGHCSVETYESEEDYINAIRNYIKKGYVVTN
jgi:hypothetical protein